MSGNRDIEPDAVNSPATAPTWIEIVETVWKRSRQHKVIQWSLAYLGAAFVLVQVEGLIAQTFDWPIAIARVFYSLLAMGLPIAATLAWYQGHLGLKRLTANELLIIAALLVGGCGALFLMVVSNAPPIPSRAVQAPVAPADRIAVIPFQAPSGDQVAQALAEGVTEEALSTLNNNRIETASEDASRRLLGTDPTKAAESLGIAYVLGGQVRREGEGFHISLHLDDPISASRVWSLGFDRPVANLPGFQQEVAAQAARVLSCAFRARSQRDAPLATSTLALFLQACAADSPDRAREILAAVIARAPRLAAAYSEMAMYEMFSASNLPEPQAAALLAHARTLAWKAHALDGHDEQAYAALIALSPRTKHWTERWEIVREGLAADPNAANVNMGASALLSEVGRGGEALFYAQRGAELKAAAPATAANVAKLLAQTGQWLQAKAAIQRATEIWPDSSQTRQDMIRIAFFGGEPERALTLVNNADTRPTDMEAPELEVWRAAAGALIAATPARKRSAAGAVVTAVRMNQLDVTVAVRLLNALGDLDDAFRVAEDPDFWPGYMFYPDMAPFRRDPRFMSFVTRLGLADFWKRTGKWPDFCDAPDRPYDCAALAAKLARSR